MGLDKLFNEPRLMNISIFIAIFVTVIIYIVLDKTTFGYELRPAALTAMRAYTPA